MKAINYDALYAAAVEIVKERNIMGFLDLISNNINFSCLNLILLHQQIPDAKAVCGANAWTALGRTIKPDAKMAALVCPEITMEDGSYVASYKPVPVIDYTSTSDGTEIKHYCPDDMIGAILAATDSSMEFVPPESISDKMKQVGAEYNTVHRVFYLSTKWQNNGQKRIEAMLDAYIEYVCGYEGIIGDCELYHAIRYVVFHYFGITSQSIRSIRGLLFTKLQEREAEVILRFLCLVRAHSFDIIESLTAPMLSFEETAVVNEQLKTGNKEEFLAQLEAIHDGIEYHEWSEIIASLHEKIEKCADETTSDLLKQKRDIGCIYTLPPYQMSVNPPTEIAGD